MLDFSNWRVRRQTNEYQVEIDDSVALRYGHRFRRNERMVEMGLTAMRGRILSCRVAVVCFVCRLTFQKTAMLGEAKHRLPKESENCAKT